MAYTALDQVFSEEILQEFEKRTGIGVKPVYDTEATKTVGLVNRILAEQDNPQCDVFWINEIVRSSRLNRRGVLSAYLAEWRSALAGMSIERDNMVREMVS